MKEEIAFEIVGYKNNKQINIEDIVLPNLIFD